MYKLIILAVTLFFSACANYPINGTMCEKKDPTDPLPAECKKYVEKDAAKSATTKKEILDSDDAIEFTKEKE